MAKNGDATKNVNEDGSLRSFEQIRTDKGMTSSEPDANIQTVPKGTTFCSCIECVELREQSAWHRANTAPVEARTIGNYDDQLRQINCDLQIRAVRVIQRVLKSEYARSCVMMQIHDEYVVDVEKLDAFVKERESELANIDETIKCSIHDSKVCREELASLRLLRDILNMDLDETKGAGDGKAKA